MTFEIIFPSLAGWEPTKKTLHLYSQAIGVIPRSHAEPHPKWWHISLKVKPNGLVTEDMPLPNGGTFHLRMDLFEHKVFLSTSDGKAWTISMSEGTPSTQFGDQIIAAVADLGLEGEYARERYVNDEPLAYDPATAEKYFTTLTKIDYLFKRHRSTLTGEVGPVQLWPHGFDLAFEWFGTRIETYEEKGGVVKIPSQLNLGFSPGDSETGPYFYSNPWPFEKELLINKPLPDGARWFTESWQGTLFPYSELVGDRQAAKRLLEYAETVFETCSPTL